MTPRHDRPILRFLGEPEAAGGPFNLLRLPPDECTDERIIASLNAQLARINDHVEADTPEADEVRLALHAAAAQLLDPNVRRHLLERHTGGALATGATPARPTPPPTASTAIEADAIVTLARYGGWNRQSLQRLTWLAHARGVSNEQVRDTLIALAHQRSPRPTPEPAAPARAAARTPDASHNPERTPDDDTAGDFMKGVLVLVAIAAVGIALGVTAITMVVTGLSGDDEAPQEQPAVEGPADSATRAHTDEPTELFPTQPKPKPVGDRPARSKPGSDRARLIRDIEQCTEGLDVDPDAALDDFDAVMAFFAESWDELPSDRLRAAAVGTVDFVYHASGNARYATTAVQSIERHAEPLLRVGTLHADDIMPAAWSIGMLTRLSREQDLPAVTLARIKRSLGTALGGHLPGGNRMVEDGIEAAIAAMPQRLVGDEHAPASDRAAWAQWLAAVGALAGDDEDLHTRLVLRGLDALLRDAPEPDTHADTRAAIDAAVAGIRWREGSEAREWLIRVFDAPAVSNADLAALTHALATRSSAEGFDIRMVFRSRDTDLRRVELRDQIALMWGLDAASNQDELSRQWRRRADDLFRRDLAEPIDHLGAAAVAAGLNRAALLRWRGEFAAATDALDAPTLGAAAPSARSSSDFPDIDPTSPVSQWAIDYTAARQNVNAKIELLGEVMNGSPFTAFEADVIASDAIRGSTSRLRSAAYEIALRHADDPAMINALIEQLPRMPRTIPNARLIARASGTPYRHPRAADWPMHARRVLVTALLDAVATGGEYADIDSYANDLRRSYAASADEDLFDADLDDLPSSEQSATILRSRWRRTAGTLTPASAAEIRLDQIDAHGSARRQIAKGPIQHFAVEQLAIAHIMGFVVASEQPDRAVEVAVIIDELAERRRSAGHIFEQLSACERAQLEFWLIRFRERTP